MPDIAIETLRECVRLEPSTGRLFWKKRPLHHFVSYKGWAIWNARWAGREACTANSHGYKIMAVSFQGDQQMMPGHRVVFALHHGRWPVGQVDHIDMNRSNNRPENLREATVSEQAFNKRAHRDSASGLKGVTLRKGGAYEARICVNYTTIPLGRFRTPEAAHAAYVAAAAQYHKEFARS